jgi:hypothetical protein
MLMLGRWGLHTWNNYIAIPDESLYLSTGFWSMGNKYENEETSEISVS